MVIRKKMREFGIDFYRVCSCGAELKSRNGMRLHRKKGHKIPMDRYEIKKDL